MNLSIDEIRNKAYSKYYAPTDKIWENWDCKRFPSGIDTNGMRQIIKEFLDKGYKVKCGYACTSIREVHDYYIFYKTINS